MGQVAVGLLRALQAVLAIANLALAASGEPYALPAQRNQHLTNCLKCTETT